MPLTHKQEFNKRLGFKLNQSHSLFTLSQLTKIPLKILEEVNLRGKGAWRTNIRSVRQKKTFIKNLDLPRNMKLSAQQWGLARVYAFINKIYKGTLNHDLDLARKI